MKVLNELRQFYPLDELLKAAEIPRSTFYYHLKALSKPDKYADVKKRIGEIYHENKGRYGYRRVTLSLIETGNGLTIKPFSA
ncbi:IS3 family transposase orfB [Enterobacter kobei]|nr:IS3 family transposase orfB [Enterobacter kobei]